jgi:PadR family transcriptional regulator, regulatory protein PadR
VWLTRSAYCLAMPERSWPADWMRSVLSLAVLAIVAEAQTYGYAVAQRLQQEGFGTVKGGTLYPVLTRLEQDGLVESTWQAGAGGPGRKYYAITPEGRAELRRRTDDWLTFTEQAARLLTSRTVDR